MYDEDKVGSYDSLFPLILCQDLKGTTPLSFSGVIPTPLNIFYGPDENKLDIN